MDSLRLAQIEFNLRKKYNDVLKQEEIPCFQKSREKWIFLGDRNTTFLHTQNVIRRKRNKIQGLFLENLEWCTEASILQSEATMF